MQHEAVASLRGLGNRVRCETTTASRSAVASAASAESRRGLMGGERCDFGRLHEGRLTAWPSLGDGAMGTFACADPPSGALTEAGRTPALGGPTRRHAAAPLRLSRLRLSRARLHSGHHVGRPAGLSGVGSLAASGSSTARSGGRVVSVRRI
jgi:hypothetical protein